MVIVTLSEKYQVVIPKELRKGLNLKPGQKLSISKDARGNIKVATKLPVELVYGSAKGAWGEDSTKYLEDLRAEANRVRH